MLARMQAPTFSSRLRRELEEEVGRHGALTQRVSQLETQVSELLQDSLRLLSGGLTSLGIPADTPQQFVMAAKGIVCKHNTMYSTVLELEDEVRQLEEQQSELVVAKEAELVGEMLAGRRVAGLEVEEVARAVKRRLEEVVAGRLEEGRKGRSYSLTRVPGDQNNRKASTCKATSSK